MSDKKLDKLPVGTRIRFVTASGKVMVLTKIRYVRQVKGIWEWNHKCVPKNMIPANYEILQS